MKPPKKPGYEYLLAYKLTVPIYDYTVEFCTRCSPYTRSRSPQSPLPSTNPLSSTSPKESPKFPQLSSNRTHDQMVQAGRSGMQNIPEGFKQQSLASYIALAGVSRGSLEELLNDYLSYARQNKLEVWDKDKAKREIREIGEIWAIIKNNPYLPASPNFPNLPTDPTKALNLLLTLIQQANYLIDKLILSLKEKHKTEGGFRENLFKKRMEFKTKK